MILASPLKDVLLHMGNGYLSRSGVFVLHVDTVDLVEPIRHSRPGLGFRTAKAQSSHWSRLLGRHSKHREHVRVGFSSS